MVTGGASSPGEARKTRECRLAPAALFWLIADRRNNIARLLEVGEKCTATLVDRTGSSQLWLIALVNYVGEYQKPSAARHFWRLAGLLKTISPGTEKDGNSDRPRNIDQFE